MSDVFARAGEAVTTPDGKIICRLKNDLRRGEMLKTSDFHEFAEGETPWQPYTTMDRRCIRNGPDGRMQICIERVWRP